MDKFLKSNETKYRLLRTIAQGIIAVLIANVDLMVSGLTIPSEYKPMIVAMIMAVLSPIMSELGKNTTDGDADYFISDKQTVFNDEGENMFEELEDENQDNSAE